MRGLVLGLTLLLSQLPAVRGLAAQEPTLQEVRIPWEQFHAGDLEAAEQGFRALLEQGFPSFRNQDEAIALAYLGLIVLERGDRLEGELLLEEALRRDCTLTLDPTLHLTSRVEVLDEVRRSSDCESCMDVSPQVLNQREMNELITRDYPSHWFWGREVGVVLLHFFVDEDGETEEILLAQTSGHDDLDAAALRVAPLFEFTPALKNCQRTSVWIQVPVTFSQN